ncbi:MAG: ATP-binding cassette domain-containing protein [Hyphomicrobiales bacterium]|nr:ATP-binding cassette domain-containing protein [Hyphomicrobiales bacterium]
MSAVLKVEALVRHFGGIVVADRIDLEIASGEVVGLIGPNGAGKTTLFNLMTGFVMPDAGTITFQGRRIEWLPPYRRAELGLARTWQSPRLFTSLSIMDNLLIADRAYPGGSLYQTIFHRARVAAAGAAARRRAQALLDRVGLLQRASSMSTQLSHGQQKLVGLARALMNDGSCLLLDEPMAGVEGRTLETMKSVIRAEAAGGKAVCVIEHNVGFIRDVCDRAAFMFNGRIIAVDKVERLLADKRLASLYFGSLTA